MEFGRPTKDGFSTSVSVRRYWLFDRGKEVCGKGPRICITVVVKEYA